MDINREEWHEVRDAAGVGKGYTKASIGDLIDRWRTVCLREGTGPRVVLKTMRALRKKITLLKGVAMSDIKAANINLYVAAMEYQDKLAKEKGLAVIQMKNRLTKKVRSIPSYLYTLPLYGLDDTKTPQKRLIAWISFLRNELVDQLRISAGGVPSVNEMVKAHPKAKAHLDGYKVDSDPLPTREEWKAHRDGAGIPQGWVKGASIGEALTAFRAAVGDLSEGLAPALKKIADDAMKPVQTAALQLYVAATKYAEKLTKEKKDTGKGVNVAEDLQTMQDVALKALEDLDFREETIQEIKRLLAQLEGEQA